MKLSDVVAEYVTYKRALGMRFNTEANIYAAFSRRTGEVPIASISADCVRQFLDGDAPVSSYWCRKHTALD
jgi:hypothetical protein